MEAEVTHKNRTEVFIEALQNYLEKIESEESFKQAVIELYLTREVSFEELAEVIDQENAEAARASKTILDQGEELADQLEDY